MISMAHKGLLGSGILLAIALVAFLTSRRYGLEARKKDKESLLLYMIANISGIVDKLDTEFEDISTQTEVARNRLRQLVALHRENVLVCAMLGERHKRKAFEKRKEARVMRKV